MMRKRLTKIEQEAIEKFTQALVTVVPERIEWVRLFGSRARGEGDEGSDLDVLVIVDKLDISIEEKIIQLTGEIGVHYGCLIAPLTVTREELTQLNYPLFRILTEAQRDGIDFFSSPIMPESGQPFREWLFKNRGRKNGMEEMIREQMAREVEEGKESLKAARVLLENDLFSHSVAKAYFAMYHLVQAILLSRSVERRKHAKLIGAFHQEFKRGGEIEAAFHETLDKAYRDRQKADYKMFKFSKEEAEERFIEAQSFIERIEKWLTEITKDSSLFINIPN